METDYSVLVDIPKTELTTDDVVNSFCPNDQARLLLVSLLENFCSLYDKDPVKNTRLFLTLCKKLCSLGILKSVDFLDDYSSIRTSYRSAFRSLVLDAMTSVEVGRAPLNIDEGDLIEPNVSELSSIMASDTHSKTETEQSEFHLSRFSSDFVVISHIGKGGYGRVVRARNLLDQRYYAVKIIPIHDFSSTNFSKIIREVKSLARLEHSNIVRYYSAWIESSPDCHSYESDDSLPTESSEGSLTVRSSSDSQGSELHNAHHLKIYIQMELCEFTLEDYLFQRNMLISEQQSVNETTIRIDKLVSIEPISNRYCINFKENMRIFKGIVKGLHYIHEQGLMHRDLKPSNILFSCDNFIPKIGDFGLASDVKLHSGKGTSASHQSLNAEEIEHELTSGVGTKTYASPEQLKSVTYDEKSDIFSLAIIFFELFYPFQTQMERSLALQQIKEKKLFPVDFVRKWPKEVLMLSHTLFTTFRLPLFGAV